jgi:hypothetical protein
MKSALIAVLFCFCVPFIHAGEFVSESIPASGLSTKSPIHVAQHRFLRIRNFTQDTAGTRGVVSVSTDGGATSTTVMTAALTPLIPLAAPEIINSVVIAGPADVTIKAGSAGLTFVTYTKEHDSD